MLKNITRRGAWLGAAALIVMTVAPAQAATDKPTGVEADASAITATGSIVGNGGLDLNTEECKAKLPGGKANGAGLCGNGLDTNANIDAFSQVASANKGGTSAAGASVAPIDLANLTSIGLNDLIENGLAGLNTGTILDSLLSPVANLIVGGLQPLLDALDGVLDQVTSPLDNALPITLQVGAVESQCSATADTRAGHTHANDSNDHAEGTSQVASLNLTVDLGPGGVIVVPLTGPNAADTPPNTNLLVGAPQELVDAILDAVQGTLSQSLGGILDPLNLIVAGLKDQVIDTLLEALEPTLLQGLADLLEPIVKGTVNKQTPVSPVDGEDAEIDVTALDLTLLDASDATRQHLEIARVHCGPNDRIDDDNNGGNGKADFQVLKTEKVKGDNKIEWTIKVRNPKSATAHNVVVKDFYPKAVKGDVEVEEGPSTGTFDEDTGVWKIPTLGGKKVATLVIKAKVKKSKLDDGIKNVACAVTKNGAFRNINDDKPDKIQKNDTFNDDTDGCDSSGSQKDKDDDTPKEIDSGVNGGGNLGALAATGLLAVAALGGTAVRQRRLVA